MTAVNASGSRRFHKEGCAFRISKSSSDYEVGLVVEGSITIDEGGISKTAEMDTDGTYTGNWIPGNERMSRVTLSINATKDGLTGASEVNALAQETIDSTSGYMDKLDITIVNPDAPNGSSGIEGVLQNCVLDTKRWSAGANGSDPDRQTFNFLCADPNVDWSTFSP